jgi:hypothetical protein
VQIFRLFEIISQENWRIRAIDNALAKIAFVFENYLRSKSVSNGDPSLRRFLSRDLRALFAGF